MVIANLFHVTESLQRLVRLNVSALLVRQGEINPVVNVTAMPPERVRNVTQTLNLHLFHAMEDAHWKNVAGPGTGNRATARQPLALSLFYILTAHHEVNDVFDAERQQRLMGLAMKTLHDFPRITEGLRIAPGSGPPQDVMVAALQGGGNAFDVVLRPITAEESTSFWSSEQSSTARLSAYYEVRTTLLEPEEPTTVGGRVFDMGLFVSAGVSPVLQATSATMSFVPPAAAGFGPQAIETSPARVTLQDGLSPPVNHVVLTGSALSGGRPGAARIVLRTQAWRERLPPVIGAPVDPALNGAWNVAIAASSAQFDMQGTLDVELGDGVVTLEVTPGIYAASVQVERRRTTPLGVDHVSFVESNQIAFSVGARITGFVVAGARIELTIHNAFDVTNASLDVQLAVDGQRYDETTAAFADNAADDAGLFLREDGQLQFHPLFDPTQSGAHPVRLVINGAESQPFWIEIP